MKDTVPSPGVRLSLPQARAAYKDLVTYDALKYVDSLKTTQLADYKFTIDELRKERAIVEERERNWKLAFEAQKLLSQDWESKYKKATKKNNWSKFWGWGKGVAGFGLGLVIGNKLLK